MLVKQEKNLFSRKVGGGGEAPPAPSAVLVLIEAKCAFPSDLTGSLHDLIPWSTFGKHENSSLLNNFSSTSWKNILKLGNL